MLFVLTITLWSLGGLTIANLRAVNGVGVELINAVAAGVLILLALFLAVTALVKVRGEKSRPAVDAA